MFSLIALFVAWRRQTATATAPALGAPGNDCEPLVLDLPLAA